MTGDHREDLDAALDEVLTDLFAAPPPGLIALVHGHLAGRSPAVEQGPVFTEALVRALARAQGLTPAPALASPEPESESENEAVITTEEELAGYAVVRELVADILPPGRISYRDRARFFGVIVDGDERQTLCRLHFNRVRKYVGIFTDATREKKHRVDGPEGIAALREPLREAARRWQG